MRRGGGEGGRKDKATEMKAGGGGQMLKGSLTRDIIYRGHEAEKKSVEGKAMVHLT